MNIVLVDQQGTKALKNLVKGKFLQLSSGLRELKQYE